MSAYPRECLLSGSRLGQKNVHRDPAHFPESENGVRHFPGPGMFDEHNEDSDSPDSIQLENVAAIGCGRGWLERAMLSVNILIFPTGKPRNFKPREST